MIRANSGLTQDQALDFACEEAARLGIKIYDAVTGETESLGIEIFEGKIKSTEIAGTRGLGIRLFRDGKPGFAFTERLTTEALRRTVADALSHTELTDTVEMDLPEPVTLPKLDLQSFNPQLQAVSLDSMKELGLKLELIAKDDSRIENIPYLGVSRSSGLSMVRNSKGVNYQSNSNAVSAGLGVVSRLGEERKMGVYSTGSRSFNFDPDFMAKTAVERSVELLNAKPLASGNYSVVLSNRISPQLFSMFSSPFYAEAVQKGQSRLQGKIGHIIANPIFNLISDPFIPGAPGSHLFDGEGVAAQKVEVIREGILQTYLYNLESSKKDNVVPTGNGSRGYSGKAGTGFANYRVSLGNQSLDELLTSHAQCFYVVKLEGGSGCSAVSGEISIGAQGFFMEGGKRIHPVDRVTLSLNFFDLLMGIRALSNQYSDTFSSVKVPDVLLENVRVSG